MLQNEQRFRRTTRDYIRPSFSNAQFGLVAPPIEANNFKPDSVTIQIIHECLCNIPALSGNPNCAGSGPEHCMPGISCTELQIEPFLCYVSG